MSRREVRCLSGLCTQSLLCAALIVTVIQSEAFAQRNDNVERLPCQENLRTEFALGPLSLFINPGWTAAVLPTSLYARFKTECPEHRVDADSVNLKREFLPPSLLLYGIGSRHLALLSIGKIKTRDFSPHNALAGVYPPATENAVIRDVTKDFHKGYALHPAKRTYLIQYPMGAYSNSHDEIIVSCGGYNAAQERPGRSCEARPYRLLGHLEIRYMYSQEQLEWRKLRHEVAKDEPVEMDGVLEFDRRLRGWVISLTEKPTK